MYLKSKDSKTPMVVWMEGKQFMLRKDDGSPGRALSDDEVKLLKNALSKHPFPEPDRSTKMIRARGGAPGNELRPEKPTEQMTRVFAEEVDRSLVQAFFNQLPWSR